MSRLHTLYRTILHCLAHSARGHNWYHGLEVKLNPNVSSGKGLSCQIAYTSSKTINGDGYRNGWPYQNARQIHWLANTDRTQVLAVTSVYDLPFGRGRHYSLPLRLFSTLL